MRHLKPLMICCLCLTMLATSVTGAFARGQMAFGQTLLICAEGEPAIITLDGRGNPVTVVHSCPECLAVTVGLPAEAVEFVRPLGHWQRITVPLRARPASQSAVPAFARGPPALI